MPQPHRIFKLSFAALTAVSIALTIFTFGYYLGIYSAMRSFSLSVSEFQFDIQYTNYVETFTTITIDNPSTFQFSLQGASQVIHVNNRYLGTSFAPDISLEKPAPILPQTTRNVTMNLKLGFDLLSEEKIESLTSSPKAWNVAIYLTIEGPVIGTFYMNMMERIETS